MATLLPIHMTHPSHQESPHSIDWKEYQKALSLIEEYKTIIDGLSHDIEGLRRQSIVLATTVANQTSKIKTLECILQMQGAARFHTSPTKLQYTQATKYERESSPVMIRNVGGSSNSPIEALRQQGNITTGSLNLTATNNYRQIPIVHGTSYAQTEGKETKGVSRVTPTNQAVPNNMPTPIQSVYPVFQAIDPSMLQSLSNGTVPNVRQSYIQVHDPSYRYSGISPVPANSVSMSPSLSPPLLSSTPVSVSLPNPSSVISVIKNTSNSKEQGVLASKSLPATGATGANDKDTHENPIKKFLLKTVSKYEDKKKMQSSLSERSSHPSESSDVINTVAEALRDYTNNGVPLGNSVSEAEPLEEKPVFSPLFSSGLPTESRLPVSLPHPTPVSPPLPACQPSSVSPPVQVSRTSPSSVSPSLPFSPSIVKKTNTHSVPNNSKKLFITSDLQDKNTSMKQVISVSIDESLLDAQSPSSVDSHPELSSPEKKPLSRYHQILKQRRDQFLQSHLPSSKSPTGSNAVSQSANRILSANSSSTGRGPTVGPTSASNAGVRSRTPTGGSTTSSVRLSGSALRSTNSDMGAKSSAPRKARMSDMNTSLVGRPLSVSPQTKYSGKEEIPVLSSNYLLKKSSKKITNIDDFFRAFVIKNPELGINIVKKNNIYIFNGLQTTVEISGDQSDVILVPVNGKKKISFTNFIKLLKENIEKNASGETK